MRVRSRSEWNWMPMAGEVQEEKYSCAGLDLESQMNCHGILTSPVGKEGAILISKERNVYVK